MIYKLNKASVGIISILFLISLLSFRVMAENKTVISLSAHSAILIEGESGTTIFEKNADERLPMASTTKIMTAIVALENTDLDKVVSIADEAVGVEGSSIYLKSGDSMTMRDLLYSLMLASANDAATAIAYEISCGVDEFAVLMNEKAEQLGLVNTHFTNPHGLSDAEHYTTARELSVIASYAMKNSTFRDIVSTKRYTITPNSEDGSRVIVNHNKLLMSYDGVCGVKTGYTTDSGRCLVSSAERDGVFLIAVTLDASDDWDDHKAMLDMGFEAYERVQLAEVGEFSVEIPCIGGNRSYVKCSNTDSLSMTLPRGVSVASRIEADRYFPAPVRKGDAIATAVFYVDGEEIARLPLFAEYSVKQNRTRLSFFERVLQLLGR